MTEDTDRTDEDARSNDHSNGFSFTRRGMLAAGAAGLGLAGASGAAGAQESGRGGDAPFAELRGIHEVDPNVDDIGAEIQRIHDEVADEGDGIYVPPGEYHNQQTPIVLSKSVSLFSTGHNMHSPGATLFKQGDFVSLETTFESGGPDRWGNGQSISGIRFSGEDVDDSSPGVVFHSVVNAIVYTDHHGDHGCFIQNDDDELHNTNWSEMRIRSVFNSGDGIRIENTSGDTINLNAMRLEVYSAGNDGDGVVDRDGYDNRFYGDSAANGGKGWDIGGRSQFGVIRQEQNDEESVFPCRHSMFFSLTPVSNRVDLSSVSDSTQIQRGAGLHNGTQVVNGDVDLGGSDLTNVAKYRGSADAPDDTMYFNTIESVLEYKDMAGEVHVLSGDGMENTEPYEPDTVHYEAANKTITPDGDLETEGLSTWNVDEQGTLVELGDSGTAGTVGGDIWMSWDADNLYVMAAIDDQTHAQPYDINELWKGDSVIVTVAPGPKGWTEFLWYRLALAQDETLVYGQIQSSSGTRDARVRNLDAQFVRDDATEVTRYEVAIPWTELDALGGFDPASDEYLGVDWAIMDNDDDTQGLDNYVQWDVTGGSAIIGSEGEPDQLKVAHLVG